MFQKLTASVLALACVLSLNVTAFAAATPAPGTLVDSDGNLAMNSSQNIKPGDDYYYIIGESSKGYDTYTNRDNFSFTLKKVEGGKYVSNGELVEKRFNNIRFVCIGFTIKDSYSSSEYKLVLDANFRARKDMIATNGTSLNSDFPIFVPGTIGGGTPSTPQQVEAARLDWVAKDNDRKAKDVLLTSAKAAAAKAKLAYDAKVAADGNSATTDQTALNNLRIVAEKANDDYVAAQGTLATAQQNLAIAQATKATAQKLIDDAIAEILKLAPQKAAIGEVVSEFSVTGATWETVNLKITAYNTLANRDSAAATLTLLTIADADLGVVTKTSYIDEQTRVGNLITTQEGIRDLQTNKDAAGKDLSGLETAVTGADQTVKDKLALKNIADSAYQAKLNEMNKATRAASSTQDLLNEYNRLIGLQNTEQRTYDNAKTLADAAKITYDNALKNVVGTGYLPSGETKTTRFSVWIQNEQRTDSDAVITVGEKGVVIRPEKNERNTVTWESGSGYTVARMVFTADSSSSYYCPTLSTKMDSRADYYDYFVDRDAYMFNFVDNPRIPATTRASLSLYNPFIDRDGESSVRTRDLYVYQLSDGELTNVTDKFTPGENEDGDDVLTTRTITLGTYIVTDHSVRLIDRTPARPNDDIDSGMLYPNGNKPIPNTGR